MYCLEGGGGKEGGKKEIGNGVGKERLEKGGGRDMKMDMDMDIMER